LLFLHSLEGLIGADGVLRLLAFFLDLFLELFLVTRLGVLMTGADPCFDEVEVFLSESLESTLMLLLALSVVESMAVRSSGRALSWL